MLLIVILQTCDYGYNSKNADGLFLVLQKINNNAYKIKWTSHYNVSAIFNVANLSPFVGNSDDETDSRTSLFKRRMVMHVVQVLMHNLIMSILVGMKM